MDRVNRQRLISGWRQGLVASASIDVLTDSCTPPLLTESFLLGSVLLGIGQLRILGHPHTETLIGRMQSYADAIQSSARFLALNDLGPDNEQGEENLRYRADFRHGPPTEPSQQGESPTRTAWGRLSGARAIWGIGAPSAAMALDRSEGDASSQSDDDAGLSLLLAGACLSEIVRLLIPLPAWTDSPLFGPIQFPADPETPRPYIPEQIESLAMIGAGAIGNWFVFGLLHDPLAQKQPHLFLVDDDEVQWSNLNRQVLFTAENVGQSKVTAMQEKLDLLGWQRVQALHRRMEHPQFFQSLGLHPDLLVSCLDNWRTRALVNDAALEAGLPLLNGGSDPYSANAHLYLPGRSACLNCTMKLRQRAEDEVAPQSCAAADPSVVFTNMIAAGMMLWQLRHPPKMDQGLLAYDLTLSERIGRMELFSREETCRCRRPIAAGVEVKNSYSKSV
ncbi:ThiF family adenylyltransferase [candidate division KSB1 bacterium]|nr:ThiF family adenylyltransferase [candidate division KSB1 bacterium]